MSAVKNNQAQLHPWVVPDMRNKQKYTPPRLPATIKFLNKALQRLLLHFLCRFPCYKVTCVHWQPVLRLQLSFLSFGLTLSSASTTCQQSMTALILCTHSHTHYGCSVPGECKSLSLVAKHQWQYLKYQWNDYHLFSWKVRSDVAGVLLIQQKHVRSCM